jgi:phage FluMu protein Com
MRGSQAKRGTKGLRKRCPRCKKLRRFYYKNDGNTEATMKPGLAKRDGRWTCPLCIKKEKHGGEEAVQTSQG